MSVTDRAVALVPEPFRSMLLKRREVVKFLLVGGTCYLISAVLNYVLKFTVLTGKPVTALTIANVIAATVSYFLNREWSFRTRGGRRRHHEASLFFLVSAIAVALSSLPMYVSRYVFQLQEPTISRPSQELADFISGLIIGTLLGLVFRLWAFRRFVFPHENVRPGRQRGGQADSSLATVTDDPADADAAPEAPVGADASLPGREQDARSR